MPRPLPTVPRGVGRRSLKAAGPRQVLLAYPKVSPEWEMGALRALMKPHDWTRAAIAHRPPEQAWPTEARGTVEQIVRHVLDRLDPQPPPRLHFPEAGDFWFIVEGQSAQVEDLKALGLVLSARLPGNWLTLDRLYTRDGQFFRRKRDGTFKLRLVPASSVHLTRTVRAAIRGMI